MFHAGSTLAARLDFNVYLVRSQAGERVKHSLRPSMPLFSAHRNFPRFLQIIVSESQNKCLSLLLNCFNKATTNSTLYIMKKTNIILCGGYESPAVNVLDVMSEGVLCASGDFSIGDWEKDDESLDF